MSIATDVLAHTGIMRKKHRADRRYDKMSIATGVLAQAGIMRKKHRADRRYDKMSIATECACTSRHNAKKTWNRQVT